MRLAAASLLFLVALGVGMYQFVRKEVPLIEILATGRLPAGATHLDMADSPTYRAKWMWPLRIRSRAGKGVHLAVRFEGEQPPPMSVSLAGNTLLLPGGEIEPSLEIKLPRTVGNFSGKVILYSDDLPDWSYTYTFKGNVIKKPFSGRYLKLVPVGIDLGKGKAGSVTDFQFTLRSMGERPVTIREWRNLDGRMALKGVSGGEVIAPGTELVVLGRFTAPPRAGMASSRLRIFSDAENGPEREFQVRLKVIPDYAVTPPRIVMHNVFLAEQKTVELTVRAAADVPAFLVGQVNGKNLFDAIAMGGADPARQKTIRLRLKKDATTGKAVIRIRVDPSGEWIDVPVDLTVLEAIYAVPRSVNFGRVALRGGVSPREVRLVAMPGRRFLVKQVVAPPGFVAVMVGGAGMQQKIRVWPNPNLRSGITDGVLRVLTDDPDVKELRIPLRINVG